MIPEDIINEIKYRNDIETAVSQYVNLKRRAHALGVNAACQQTGGCLHAFRLTK